MKSKNGIFSDIANEAKSYGNLQKQLYRLRGVQKGSKAGAIIIAGIIILLLALFTLVFAGLATAAAFTILWGSEWAGYLSVTVIYLLLIFLVIWMLKKGIIRNIIVKQALQKDPAVKNSSDLDKEINRLKAEVKSQETAFKESFINPAKYIIPLKVLAWIIKSIRKKK